MLEISDLVCGYGQVAALRGISLTVGEGQLVALVGANGAGKSTTLRTISGLVPARAGSIAYILGSVLAGVSGLLIAPVNTIFYDSGFLIGLKAFVGAMIGGLHSYPGAALGALFVGLLESFASFQSSSLKDVIVFSVLVPILVWRSFVSLHVEEEDEE